MSLLPLRRFSWTSALIVVGLLIGVGAAASTVSAALSVQSHGNAAARALNAVPSELDASHVKGAMDSIAVAERELADARGALGNKMLRVAGALPLARSYVQDANQLIAAATVMADAGRRITRLDNVINGTGGFLFWTQQVDLHALRVSAPLARSISNELARAQADLDRVTYVPGGHSLLAARQHAMTRLHVLLGTVDVLRSPGPLARALGSRQTQRYLVIERNNSAALPSGGAPIATAVVTVRDGAVAVSPGPAVTRRLRWHHVSGDPWLPADGRRHNLADALASPSFPIAAKEALGWADAGMRRQLDGVVSMDASAIAGFTAVTGHAELPRGVKARTLPALLAPTTSLGPRAFAGRARKILVATLRQAVDVRHATARLNALGLAATAGDLKVFSRHRAMQSLLLEHAVSGELPLVRDDEVGLAVAGPPVPVGAHTTQRVALAGGRAAVTRTTDVTLPAAATVTEYAPALAVDVQLEVDGVSTAGRDFGDVNGRQAISVRLPAGTHALRLGYRIPAPEGGVYSLAVDGQPGLAGPTTVQVFNGSFGGPAARDTRWTRMLGGYQITVPAGGRQVVTLAMAPATGFWHWLWDSGGRLLGWLVVCLLLALAGRRRLWVPLGVALTLYGVIPMAGGHWITGIDGTGQGALDLHPATWLVLVTAAVQLVYRPRDLLALIWREPVNRLAAVLMTGLLVDAVGTALLRHSGGWSQTVQSLLAAPLVALLVLLAVRRHPESARRAGKAILGFALALSVLAMIEGLVGRNLLFASDYNQLTWAQIFARNGFRAATTLDEPLNTGLVLVVALALARLHLRGRLRWAAMTVLLLGVVATGSRTAFVIGVAYAGWSVSMDRRTTRHSAPASVARKFGYAGVAIAVLALGLLTPPGLRLIQRGLADGGSGGLRVEGLRAFLPHLPQHLLFGSGVGTSEHLTRAWMHSPNSAENPLVMTAVDLGVLGAAALVVALVWLARVRWRRRPSLVQQAFLLALATSLGYSSFATTSVAVIVVWLFAALASADVAPSSEPDPAVPPPNAARLPSVVLQAKEVRVPAGLVVPVAREPVTVAPQVSAIMAARDTADTVAIAVTSVLSQSFTDWELVVVDDGSSDGTAVAVHAVAAGDPRVRVLRYEEVVGRGAARNAALAHARGRYVAICDADDWCRPDRFAQQVAYLDSHPEIGVLGGQIANFGSWGGPEIVYRYPTDPAAVRARLLRGHAAIPHQTAMIRRELLGRVGGYDPACVRAQDLELFLRLQALADMANLDRVLVDYRHSRRTTLPYWLDNGRWRRFAIARASAVRAAEVPPEAEDFHRRPTVALATAYDIASYVRSRYVLSRRGVRSL